MTITAVTFDFWQTLYASRPIDFNKRVRQFRNELETASGAIIDQAKFEAAIKVARDTWRHAWEAEYRTLDAGEWLSIVLQYLKIPLNRTDRITIQTDMENRVLAEKPFLTEDGRAILADLSARYRLAIISDTGITPGRVLRTILDRDELSGYFCHLTFSDEIGHSKPHPHAFLSTLDALGVEPAAAVHVGDLLRTDVAGAQNVGMRAVQYIGLNGNGWPKNTDASVVSTVTPDAVIDHHIQLKPLLQRWSNSA